MVGRVFEDVNNYMKNGTLIRQVINKLNAIDFNKQQDLKVNFDFEIVNRCRCCQKLSQSLLACYSGVYSITRAIAIVISIMISSVSFPSCRINLVVSKI
jgi:hypothetical protein